MATTHYRDSCPRCVELEDQLTRLQQERYAMNNGLKEMWTWSCEPRHGPFDTASSFFAGCLEILAAVVLMFLTVFATWASGDSMNCTFYSLVLFVPFALTLFLLECKIVKKPVYVRRDE
jgi:hypothetical protein